jgi:N-methylhydantoinase A/oxoprolinase/acetone carboxylase beta subunit
MKSIFVIACAVLAKDLEQAAKDLQLTVGTRFLPGGLHEAPGRLHQQLQAAIDQASQGGRWDRIAIGYGVCGRGTVGIQARGIPLSIPRVHDCISLFLGGDRLYQEQFKRFPGTYYVTEGWLAGKNDARGTDRPFAWMGDTKVYLDELEKQYGAAHARETFAFLNSWRGHYQRAAYIDTGTAEENSPAKRRAQKMAAANNWTYEELKGSHRLLRLLLTAEDTTDEIVVVPPQHAIVFDAVRKGLSSRPLSSGRIEPGDDHVQVAVLKDGHETAERPLRFGLGIDAGGTYTDAVVYDFETETVTCKNKALTTRWDFTVGIREALAGLDGHCLSSVQLVSVSTTLATNAIVEGEGQNVGLLIMPPPGFDRDEKLHFPQHCLSARLDITGKEIAALNEEEVRRTARRLCRDMAVEAFAVSGYAGSINPEHELRVKAILASETGKFVCCGHELSQMLNFKRRAETAVHNARIVPRVMQLLEGVSEALGENGIHAPVMVVRGDGSLMGRAVAQERPVETILSGPAASIAGVRYLTKADDAIVVDMGGTTTDIAGLEDGGVRLCSEGARVGSARTHVKALEIFTTGLGGDSFIAHHQGEWRIGPARVAPVAWLGHYQDGLDAALIYLEARRQRFRSSTLSTQLLTLNHRDIQLDFSDAEKRILDLLADRPHSLDEIARRTDAPHPGAVPLKRLDAHFIVQRCGLTPTDLLHVAGRFNRWDATASDRMVSLLADIFHLPKDDMVSRLMRQIRNRLTMEILTSQLGTLDRSGGLESCRTCRNLFAMLLGRQRGTLSVRIKFRQPIIGVGAPISQFLPAVSELLEVNTLIPENQDVANAIGAITSLVRIERRMSIKPDGSGKFYIQGLAGHRRFDNIAEAERHARHSLVDLVRELARKNGTRQMRVTVKSRDMLGRTATGEEIFLGRQMVARLKGRPDVVDRG